MTSARDDREGTPERARAAHAPRGDRALAWAPAALAALVVVSRWPAIALDGELNPDESQFMAQVMRVAHHPLPWRGFDGTTCGPLGTYALAFAHALGLPLTYPAVHAFAAALLAANVVLVAATLRLRFRSGVAALGALAAATALAFAPEPNFVHFASELVPALIATLAAFCMLAVAVWPNAATLLLAAGGVLAGALPWTKLQAAPLALVLVVALGAEALAAPARTRRLASLAFGALLPSVVLFAVVIASGAAPDFWHSYVLGNLAFMGGPGAPVSPRKLAALLAAAPGRQLAGLLVFVLAWTALGRPGWRTAAARTRRAVLAFAALAAAAAFAVVLPHGALPHYQLLLVAPVALLGAALAGLAHGARVRLGVLLALALLLPPATRVADALRAERALVAMRADAERVPTRRLGRIVRELAPAARSMFVWGWAPALYVEAGIVPAARHVVGHFLVDPGPAREPLRASLLADLERERPDVIVDAIAAGCFRWRTTDADAIESDAPLAGFVRAHYRLAASVQLAAGGPPARVFLRDSTAAARP